MSRSFNTLPKVRFEKVTLARSGRRTYKVRGKFEEMRTIPQYREPRPMVIPEQDHVQIRKFRRTIHIQNFRLNPQESYTNRTMIGMG